MRPNPATPETAASLLVTLLKWRHPLAPKPRSNPDDNDHRDHRDQHRPPEPDAGAPMSDVEVVMPDYYEHPAWYATGEDRLDPGASAEILRVRGRPWATVWVYRAVPRDVKSIAPGDWVTHVRGYAKDHLDARLKGKGKIIKARARAGSLFTDGNSHLEWGWWPDAEREQGFERLRRQSPGYQASVAKARSNPASPESASSLLDSITLDSKGRVKGSTEELVRWLKAAIADSLPPGGEIDRYGNMVYEADVNGEARKFRYHFTAQRVQFQARVGGEWVTRNSYPFKDLAQRVYANLAKLAGREEAREQAKAGAKVRKEAKVQAQAKLAQRRQKNSEQGLRGIQIEVEHPELVRRLVLEQDLQARDELRPLLEAVSPAASSQPPPRGFYLAPFALPVDAAPSMAWTAQLPTGESVSVAQVPVKNERTRMVTSCDLHIGRAGDFGLMVSPRKHSVSFSPAAFKGQGPGYLSATWDLEQLDVGEGARIRSELFFVIAHEKRRGIGRELVRLWLEAARMVTGGGKRMDLRIVSIVDAAWPFWLQLAKEGLYEVLQATSTSLRVR